ncbi:retrotransposon protein, putative, ty1-copia subclass [Tanacetum coccineum]
MFEISGNNFNDWFRQLKIVLRVEKKLFVIEQPISLASPTDSEYLRSGMRYMIHNEELKSMFEKQAGVEWFDLIQTFHACKQDEGKPVGPYHNMGKTVGELHAMLNEYKKGLPKKAETPQVMMIKGGKIQKSNKKSLKSKAKDDTCHHCKEVGQCKRNCPAYLAELIKKKKQVGTASSSDVFIIELFSFPTKSWVYDTSCDNCHYAPSILRGVVSVYRLVENGFVQCFTDFGISVSKNNVHYLMLFPVMGKDKQVYIPEPKNPKPSAKEHPAKDDTCHHCKEVGHCKRNCPAYLVELIKKKKQVGTASSSDVFII